jgi:hypothetical protein
MAIRSAWILILLIVSAVPSAAQSEIAVGPLLGLCKAQDANGYRVFGGGALRFKFSEILGVEGSFNYGGEDYGNGTVEVKSVPVMVTGLLYPIPGVYGSFGAGWYHTFVSYNVSSGLPGGLTSISRDTRQQFGWHFGVGVELPVFSFVRLVGDIRYVYLNKRFNSVPGNSVVSSNSPLMTAGLLFGL